MKNETTHQTWVGDFLESRGNRISENLASVAIGFGFLTALAQISIRLPWTPVPITGQTFGVALIALTWGRTRAIAIVLAYLVAGASGLPVFAGLQAGVWIGPTVGYLIGMLFASALIGSLADRGWAKKFTTAWLAATLGSALTFAWGLAVLSLFVPTSELFVAGVLPFLPGDLIKNSFAAWIASGANRVVKK